MDRLKINNLKRFLEILNECSENNLNTFEFTHENYENITRVGIRELPSNDLYNMFPREVAEWRSLASKYDISDYYRDEQE